MTQNKVSQHILDKKRQNRRQIIWSVALATIIVLAMTYYDVKFRTYIIHEAAAVEYHYLGSDSDEQYVPDDYTSLTIWQGVLAPQTDGSVTIEGAPVTPANFPQRQIDLNFALASLPDNAQAALVKTIGDIIHSWEAKNNLVMDAVIDIRELNGTPVERLENLIADLHETYKGQYRYTLAFDPLDKEDLLFSLSVSEREKLMKTVFHLAIRVTSENAAAAIAAADTLGYRFSVMVPPGTDLDTFETDAVAKAKYFSHFIRDVTPPATQ